MLPQGPLQRKTGLGNLFQVPAGRLLELELLPWWLNAPQQAWRLGSGMWWTSFLQQQAQSPGFEMPISC